MKTVKLRKKHYSDLAQLMRDCGVVDEKNKSANPSIVFANPSDLKKMRKELRTVIKKQYPNITKKGIDFAVECEMLNLSPNECEGIKEGWVVVCA